MAQEALRAEIRDLIRSGCHIKLLGDSLTIGTGSSDDDQSGPLIYPPFYRQKGTRCWASLLQKHVARYNCTVDNMGCYGTTSTDLIEHLNQLYDPKKDQLVICMIGSNDRKMADGMVQLRHNLTALCEKVLADGNKLVLMTPNPATAANDAKPSRIYPQSKVVETIRAVAKDYADRVLLIDNYLTMEAECRLRGCAIEEFLQVGVGADNDGLHPGDDANYFYFEHICVYLGI